MRSLDTPLSSPGLTGRSSTPRRLGSSRAAAAYWIPAFGEARIVEFGSGLRPAFPDNLPRIGIRGNTISVNGLYRHGFLIAPVLAELTLSFVERGQIDNEVMQCA